MRDKLIAALERVRAQEARERAKEMTDDGLEAIITDGLGLPTGTKFSEEQLHLIARSYKSEGDSPVDA